MEDLRVLFFSYCRVGTNAKTRRNRIMQQDPDFLGARPLGKPPIQATKKNTVILAEKVCIYGLCFHY